MIPSPLEARSSENFSKLSPHCDFWVKVFLLECVLYSFKISSEILPLKEGHHSQSGTISSFPPKWFTGGPCCIKFQVSCKNNVGTRFGTTLFFFFSDRHMLESESTGHWLPVVRPAQSFSHLPPNGPGVHQLHLWQKPVSRQDLRH